MQDWIITPKRRKKELLAWILCFTFMVIVNVISIIKYNTPWRELYSQLHIVFFLSIVFYVIVLIIRMIVNGVIKLFRK